MKQSSKGYSIIEILIGIFIFTLGLISVYLVINSSINVNDDNKNKVIALGLSKEGIELVKNIRDSNYNKISNWTFKNTNNFGAGNFEYGKYYKIENDYSGNFPIKVNEILDFGEGISLLDTKMQDYRLCQDNDLRYTYDCSGLNNKTKFYRFIKFEKVEYFDGTNKEIENSMKITSKVIWVGKRYREVELKTVITDWKRL